MRAKGRKYRKRDDSIKMRHIGATIPQVLYDWIERTAKAQGISFSEALELALLDGLPTEYQNY